MKRKYKNGDTKEKRNILKIVFLIKERTGLKFLVPVYFITEYFVSDVFLLSQIDIGSGKTKKNHADTMILNKPLQV